MPDGEFVVSDQKAFGSVDRAALYLSLIGELRAWTMSTANALPTSSKSRAILAILALIAPHHISRSQLIALLWSRRYEMQARASLRQEIHRLTTTLDGIHPNLLSVSRDHLALRSDLVWTDVEEVRNATVTDASALDLLDKELLAELDGLDPALDRRLSEERKTLRDRASLVGEALLGQQRSPQSVISAAQTLLKVVPFHEEAYRELIRAYASCGQRRLAIEAFERCRSALADRLGAVPSAETCELISTIRSGSGFEMVALPSAPDNSNILTTPSVVRRLAARSPSYPAGIRVAVLRLQSVSDHAEGNEVSAIVSNEMAAALTKFRWLSVVPVTSFDFPEPSNILTLQQQFGLHYVITGSVRQLTRRLRITIRLIDLRDQHRSVWTHQIDRESADDPLLHEEVAAEITAMVERELAMLEGQRALLRPVDDSTPYELELRARVLVSRLQREDIDEAESLLSYALDLDPNYALAHVERAICLSIRSSQGWTAQDVAGEAGRHAERAVALAPLDARVLTIAGHIRLVLQRRPYDALELFAHALALNPCLPIAWAMSAMVLTFLGELEEADRRFTRYKQLLPVDAYEYYLDTGIVIFHLYKKDYLSAVRLGRHVTQLKPNFAAGLRYYLSALGHAGLLEDAADILQRLLAIDPSFTVQAAIRRSPYLHWDATSNYADGLRIAGVTDSTAVSDDGGAFYESSSS